MNGDPIHGSLHIPFDPVTRLVEENLRVGWKIHEWGGSKAWEKGTGDYWEGLNKHSGTIIYFLMLWLISKWKIHGWGKPNPWMGEGRKKRKDKEYEKLRTKIICIFNWQTKLKQTYNELLDVESVPPQAFISSLSVALVPSFHIIGPLHPWIIHPIRGLSTRNRIDEYMQRSMDGDYPWVACNSCSLADKWKSLEGGTRK